MTVRGGGLLLRPQARGASMGGEAFDFTEFFNDGSGATERCLIEPDDAGASLELIDRESGERLPGPAGGQSVGGTGKKITGCNRTVVAREDCARGADFRQQ